MKANKATEARNIGLDLPQPKESCTDSKCAWHGSLPVRGRVFEGTVKSAKSNNTAIVEWGYHRFIKKFQRFERRKSHIVAHNPPCMKAREGDFVTVAECRPLSKTKNFVIVQVNKAKEE
jgi:small subunit ribosomal protein S17